MRTRRVTRAQIAARNDKLAAAALFALSAAILAAPFVLTVLFPAQMRMAIWGF